MFVEDWPGHGFPVELPGFDGYLEGFGGAGMTPGEVFDGMVEGAGTTGSDEDPGCDPLDPDEEPGSEGLVEDGGEVVGSGLDGVFEGSFVGSGVSLGGCDVPSVGVGVGDSEGVVDPEEFVGDLLDVSAESGVNTGGLSTDDSMPSWVVVLTEFAARPGDDSAAEAGRMPRDPTSIREPAMAAQRRVERWFEPGAVARIRLLHWVRRQATP